MCALPAGPELMTIVALLSCQAGSRGGYARLSHERVKIARLAEVSRGEKQQPRLQLCLL